MFSVIYYSRSQDSVHGVTNIDYASSICLSSVLTLCGTSSIGKKHHIIMEGLITSLIEDDITCMISSIFCMYLCINVPPSNSWPAKLAYEAQQDIIIKHTVYIERTNRDI